uniref:G protein-coupled receptor n=2 Tax=Bursaphelenchus xylophilus TaxID=6326 RepID=A0A1I7SI53_BURXY
VVEIKGGVCFFLPLGPFRHSPYPYNFLMASLFLGAVYTTVLTLGMQFVYRYCALCRTPLTVPQFAAMYFAGVSSMFAASFASFFVFRGVTPQDTEILRQHPAYQEDTPVYMAVDPTSVRSTAHLIFTQVIIFGVYVVIVYTASKINKKVRDATAGMSKYTRKAHRQLNKVMIMQALYPGILLGTPVIVACVGVEFRLDVPWLGIYLVPSASLLPIVNAITVMTVIPSIRKRVFGRGWADAGSTSRGVSTELKQRNLSKSLPNVEF